jgi:hypothetical protein
LRAVTPSFTETMLHCGQITRCPQGAVRGLSGDTIMTQTALHIPLKELRPGLKRYEDGTSTPAWEVWINGDLVASDYTSQPQALMELDLAAWYALFGDAPPSPNLPLTDEALGLAIQVFNRLFGAEKVQEKARTARDKIIKPGIYTINVDGSLSVLASSGKGKVSYAVKAQRVLRVEVEADAEPEPDGYAVTTACECRDFYARAHEHGGVCKHVAARMLLYLAQLGVGRLKHLRDALDTVPQSPQVTLGDTASMDSIPQNEADDGPPMAFLLLSASDLAAALFLVSRAGTPVEIHAENGQLRLVAGPIDVRFPCLDGSEAAAVRIDHDRFKALYDDLRPVAPRLGAVTVFVVSSDATVVISTDDSTFSTDAQGETLDAYVTKTIVDLATSAIATPSDAHPPVADAVTVDALYELFTLLETHEPDWYQRKHYHVAHAALTAAGRIA